MQYFFLGLLAALAATPHCLGMCGGFALHLSRAPEWRGRLLGYGLFFAGKTTVYVFLGALVGALGMALLGTHRSPAAASALAYAAGGLTVLLGVAMLIPWKPGRSSGSAEAAVASPIAATLPAAIERRKSARRAGSPRRMPAAI